MKIYVAGPYSSSSEKERLQNVERAIDAGLSLWKKGHHPYIPHLTHFVDRQAKRKGIPMSWKEYIEWDEEWLGLCDAVLFLGNSQGADMELNHAKRLGKVIFFEIGNVPTANVKKESLAVEL